MSQATKLLIAAGPSSPELKVLDQIKDIAHTVGIGQSVKDLSDLSADDFASVEVLLICGVGEQAAKQADIQEMWPKLKSLKWIHSASAGLDALLFRELVDSDVTVTNARGVYSNSLAEYALTCCAWFAKDLPRMRAAQQAKRWDQYDVEELRGKTMGMVGYGDIARSTAQLAKAYKMKVVAMRRRAQMSDADKQEGILSDVFSNEQLPEMVKSCDYIVMATPYTDKTHKLFNADAVAAMKSSAVFVNIGRGKCVDEPALVAALQQGRIRGAGLDVFYTEPLPEDSPLWELDNVFMSAHTADRTKEFQTESMQFFCKQMQAYVDSSQELQNVVDKEAGY